MAAAHCVRQRLSALRPRWSPLTLSLGVLLSLGCKVVIERSDDSAKTGVRSDTTILLPARLPETSAVSRPSQPSGAVADSTPPETTSAQLAMLSSELMIPIPGVQPSELRDTFHELRGGGTRMHEALDIMAPRGTQVLSAAPGRVLKLHNSRDGGLMVYAADSSDQFVLMYAHLDRYATGLRDDMALARGQLIGYVGTTGDAAPNAPHLHFAIAHPRDVKLWWTGTAIDPLPLLRRPAAVH